MSRKYQFTSRTKARKRAADVVYEADQRGMGRNATVLRDLLMERKVLTAALTPLPDYSIRIVEGVADELYRIDRLINAHAHTGVERIPAVDRAVLRVAVWEMLENTDEVPPVIAIDEAISIVKSISTDESAGFVNAILDAIRRDVASPGWTRERVSDQPREEVSAESDGADPVVVYEEEHASADAPRTGEVDGAASAEGEQEQPRVYPTVEDLTSADLSELDELLDEY